MKKIILIIIIISSISCKSQNKIIDIINVCNSHPFNSMNGSLYKKDISNIYQPFIGTWKWTEGNREMTLVLIKQAKFHYSSGIDNFYEDRLVGYYIYKENGIEIINTSNVDLMSDYSFKIGFDIHCDDDTGIYTVNFKDIPKNKYYEVKLEKLSSTQMKFTGKMGENSIIKTKTPTLVYGGYSFPLEMVFTKQ
ncbi:DUF6705 family protein [Chryseobacterium sp. RLHN22]|uniref:DUF6705 family protein n=1 Tax=Chryseobacterium sp. RLHN22 TaxID=3437885 RepID=UPI003D9B620D